MKRLAVIPLRGSDLSAALDTIPCSSCFRLHFRS
jgi:hypothetical protein